MYFTPKEIITVDEAVIRYFHHKEATQTLSPKSIHNRRYELKRFAEFCKSHKIEYVSDIHKNIVIAYLKKIQVSKSSKSGILYTLSSFMDYLVDEELILDNMAASIEKPKSYLPKTDYLTLPELDRLYQFEAQNGSKKMIDRNLLMFSLFTDLCLRVSEVIGLRLPDVRIDAKELWITRKRNKVERLPITHDLAEKFLNWYAIRSEYKGSETDWVFLSTHGKPLTPRQVHHIIHHALEQAGIVKRKQGPHLLRHSGASLKAQAGENIIMIQYLLGHENLNTTRRYLHFDWEELKKMVQRTPVIGNPKGTLDGKERKN